MAVRSSGERPEWAASPRLSFNGRMRLNAWLARAGVASRRKSDELIKAGRVTVNGEPGQLNTFVQRTDDVRLDGEPLAEAGSSPTCSSTSPPVSSRPRATRRVARPSSTSSTTRRASCPSAGSTPTRPVRSCSRTTATSRTGSRIRSTRSTRSTSPRSGSSRPTASLRKLADGVKLDGRRKTAPAQVRRIAGAVDRADDPRGTQPPGEAHVRGRRPPREARCTAAATGRSTSKGSSPAHGASSSPPRSKQLRRL